MLRYKPPDEALPLLSSMGPLPPFIWTLYFADAIEDFIGFFFFFNNRITTQSYWACYQQNPQVSFLMNGCQVRLFVIMQVVLFWANRMELPSFFLLNLSSFLSGSILLLVLPKRDPLELGGIRPVDLATKEGNCLVFHLLKCFLAYAWASAHAYSWIIWLLLLANALVIIIGQPF